MLYAFSFTMLYAFSFNLKCVPDTVVKEVKEEVDLLVRQEIPSFMAYQRIALNLAAGDLNVGRLLVIQFFSDSAKEHLNLRKFRKNLRNEPERVPMSELVPLVENSVHGASEKLSEINSRDRPRQRAVLDICPSPTAMRGDCERGKRNFVTFNPEIVVHLIPYEDRSSPWMQCAIDRAHFRRRVQLFEELFTAL